MTINKLLTLLTSLLSILSFGQNKIYYDTQGKETTKEKHDNNKNGLPINGASIEGKQQKNYKNGELVSIDYYKDKGYDDELRDLQYTEYYTKDQLIKVSYYTFKIIEDMQPSYTGFYNNGKAYNGYFISPETIIDNIHLVDYYENGIRLYQYSFDFLEQLDSFNKLLYDQRTIFKGGKVTTGYRYLSDKGLLLRLRYLNGKINLIEMNGFGMHAFNRNTIEYVNDEVIIKDFSSPLYLKIFKKSQYLEIELYDQNGKVDIKKPKEVADKTPNSNKIYYLEDNTIKSYNTIVLSEEYYNELRDNYKSQETLHTFYSFHPFNTQTPKEFFTEHANQFETVLNATAALKSADKESKERLQIDIAEKLSTKNKDNNNQFGFLKYNDKGEPSEGTEITKVGSTYKIDFYINDRKVKTTTYKNLGELKKKDPLTELINIYNN
ncbi:hypothetical protein [Myroides marinus]|uniref:hypothetical protein n=1 Tax=Myroides marinus TaxID=703342 RepID=UPI002575E2A8|nr:hypothetical protein [Myroides marinus]MDM1370234.1 hypothetical protein [Myroides marinus]MDM1377219.1 hypothetical protein [Myroides marinus]MDM1380954.1 hypothetical protein [Myroides marinus]MDM1384487.1 hypothetical protein [Myroides marinus]MDM1388226.1 hypothetical protein [Myroides marinus]